MTGQPAGPELQPEQPGYVDLTPGDWRGRWPGAVDWQGRHSDSPPPQQMPPGGTGLLDVQPPEQKGASDGSA